MRFIFNTKVADIQGNTIVTATGEQSNRIIVATEATALISKYKQLQKTSITQLLMFILKKSSAFKKSSCYLNASDKKK
jgi:hypothetical protein